MRELKFRIWDKADQEWTSYPPFFSSAHGKIFEFFPSKYQAENLVIQQFTGLTDKNGKEIYEGDIIEVELYEKWSSEEPFKAIHVVFYNSNRGAFVHAKDPKTFPSGMVFDPYTFDPMPCEVIGNIFETPELLKQ